jgi:hypothetical protein
MNNGNYKEDIMPSRICKIFGFFVAFGLGLVCSGRDIYVSLDGTNNYPFTNWPDAATNIEWAVNAGENSDTIWISNGTYVLTNQVTVISNLTISGLSTNNRPVVDGSSAVRCFEFTNAVTGALVNLFITRGYVTNTSPSGALGGGALMRTGTVINCVFSNNIATNGSGGGLYLAGGSIQRSTFTKNDAKYGGGVYLTETSRVDDCLIWTNTVSVRGGGMHADGGGMITNCTFIQNSSQDKAGGIYDYGLSLTHCTIVSNSCPYEGGGLYLFRGKEGRTISNCYILHNSADRFGGVFSEESIPLQNCVIASNYGASYAGGIGFGASDPGIYVFNNCIIEGNRTTGNGGGLYVTASKPVNTPVFRNCLIKNNVGGSGAGVYFICSAFSACTIASNYASSASGAGGLHEGAASLTSRFDNCVIYFNASAGSYSNYYLTGTNCVSFSNCCFSPVLTSSPPFIISMNNISADPQFVDRAAGNYRLKTSSPCVNAGVNQSWMTNAYDLDGQRRIFFRTVDMGCYENNQLAGTIYYLGF